MRPRPGPVLVEWTGKRWRGPSGLHLWAVRMAGARARSLVQLPPDRLTISFESGSPPSKLHVYWTSVENQGANRFSQPHLESPPQRGQHARVGSQAQAQGSTALAPVHLDAHPFALSVVEGAAVIFVKQERSISSGIDRNRERQIRGFSAILLHRSQRQNRSRPDVKRQRFKVHSSADLASTRQALASPEIVPVSVGKIDVAAGGAPFHDWRDQKVPAT